MPGECAIHSPPKASFAASQAYAWMENPWTGDERPFTQRERDIDKRFAMESPESVVAFYKQIAQSNPTRTMDQFAWAYAAWSSLRFEHNSGYAWSALWGVSKALATVKNPSTYQFARIRFLIDTAFDADMRYRPLAIRLLNRSPNDVEVMCHYVYILRGGGSLSDLETALSIAKKSERQGADSSLGYRQAGYVYWDLFDKTKNKAYAVLSIQGFNEYLKLSPTDDVYRTDVVYYLNAVKSDARM